MVLALRHEVLPKTLHAEHPSKQIEWEGSGLSLLQEARAWPREASRVRRAGVSSFGISGTNAHVVLEEAPARPEAISIAPNGDEAASQPLIPLLVSGRDEAALRAQAGRYGEWLSRHGEADWSSVVRTAALHRTQFAFAGLGVGAGCVGGRRSAAGAGRGPPACGGVARRGARRRGRVVFVFPGQGSQWQLGWAGRCWRSRARCLRETIAACETALSGLYGLVADGRCFARGRER